MLLSIHRCEEGVLPEAIPWSKRRLLRTPALAGGAREERSQHLHLRQVQV